MPCSFLWQCWRHCPSVGGSAAYAQLLRYTSRASNFSPSALDSQQQISELLTKLAEHNLLN